jgi:hypothetical protein
MNRRIGENILRSRFSEPTLTEPKEKEPNIIVEELEDDGFVNLLAADSPTSNSQRGSDKA